MEIGNVLPAVTGQMKPKADWGTADSPKKRTNEFVSFAANKQTNSFIHFVGESTAPQSVYGFI